MIKFRAAGGAFFVVTFTLSAYVNDGARISVVGEFNDWDPHAIPMVRTPDGAFTATADLLPGRYRFRYLTGEGRCFNDHAADDYEVNDYGAWESILDLTPARMSA